ncbi:MAG: methylated-DNA--[protein]-cysteine S-methyltransferase [Rhodobacteraceae bacterium]|nr:methylated-DNA--[protein]-cysteine S-methyltransferase [Paracoccaceae bacterium]
MPRLPVHGSPGTPAPPARRPMSLRRIQTPLGPLWLQARAGLLTAILPHAPAPVAPTDTTGGSADSPLLDAAEAQIAALISGRRERITLPMSLPASPFAHCIWEAVLSTRPGELLPLADVARALSTTPSAVARGAAGNRLFLALPCHRLCAARGTTPWPGPGGNAGRARLRALEAAQAAQAGTGP